jgi:hypothetical protein
VTCEAFADVEDVAVGAEAPARKADAKGKAPRKGK